jgi:hypothetical protein
MKPTCVVCGAKAVQVYTKVNDKKMTEEEYDRALKSKVIIPENLVEETLCKDHMMTNDDCWFPLAGEKVETIK